MHVPLHDIRRAFSDRLVVEKELGSGGASAVFLARDSGRDRAVALKILKPEIARAIGGDRQQFR